MGAVMRAGYRRGWRRGRKPAAAVAPHRSHCTQPLALSTRRTTLTAPRTVHPPSLPPQFNFVFYLLFIIIVIIIINYCKWLIPAGYPNRYGYGYTPGTKKLTREQTRTCMAGMGN